MSALFALSITQHGKQKIPRPTRAIRIVLLYFLISIFLPQNVFAGISDIVLRDATNQSVIANTKVTAYQLSSGSLIWRASGTTNRSGRLSLNIAGLGTGKKFILRINPFGTGKTQSNPFSNTGKFNYQVGTIHVKAIQGSNGNILRNHRVGLQEIVNGSRQSRGSGLTDANGLIRFSPAGITSGNRDFQLSAISPYDNKTKRSQIINKSSAYNFRVGNQLLKVRLVNKHNGAIVAKQKILVYERQSSGALQIAGNKITNTQGATDFDLPRLGSGTTYVLRSNPYGVGWTYSPNIKNTGRFDFKVGALQFKILKGQDGSVLKKFPVTLYERTSSNGQKWRASGVTNANGLVWFDPGPLNAGSALYLGAINPFDGTRKFSNNVNISGRYTFKVGNKLLNVVLKNKHTSAPVPNITVSVFKKLSNGALTNVTRKTTNSNGRVNFDLAGLGSGTSYVLKANPYQTGFTQSQKINQTGRFNFDVGALQITLVQGSNNSLLKTYPVILYKGSYANKTKVASGLTDTNGNVWFDPPNTTSGKTLFLTAKNPFDGKLKFSPVISSTGRHQFTVGNRLLNVSLKNALTGKVIPNKNIIVYKVKSGGSLSWFTSKVANSQGRTNFDLPGLGSGTNYVLKSNPLNGGWLQSNILNRTGSYTFDAGKVRIKLRKKSDGTPLAGRKIILFEKAIDGSQQMQTSATTDVTGQVYFDPTGLKQNRVYVAYSKNVFGKSNRYYSPWITSEGHINFDVDPKGNSLQDFKPPALSILSPSPGAKVSDAGFVLRGKTSDDDKVAKVTIRVKDPSVGTTAAQATLKNGHWNFPITANMIDPGHSVTIGVTAIDSSRNETLKNLSLRVISDSSIPTLQILSHRTGDSVSRAGFLLTGSAKDNTGIASLTASITDSNTGVSIFRSGIEVARNSGLWALAVGSMSGGSQLNVSIIAKDAAGNKNVKTLTLNSIPASKDATHLLSRITFGATPNLLSQVRKQGTDAFIHQQLHPGAQESNSLTAALKTIGRIDTKQKLQNYILAHATYSKWQLREVMTWFWDNHFNTDLTQGSKLTYELSENNAFRKHALGRFRDLLGASASSPAMLMFLDNHRSHRKEPNENYARELMELHTMGVNGGYTQQDVVEVARVFTGWRVKNGRFQFDSRYHDNGSKLVLGQTVPTNSGMSGGKQVLDQLARHPSTAKFICTKILKLLVSDIPSNSAVSQCSADYSRHYNQSDQIARMLSTILKSNEFKAAKNFHQKVKTPIEFVVGMMRNLDANVDLRDNSNAMTEMGMRLFHFPTPDGWPETGLSWVNTNQMRQRLQFSTQVIFNPNRNNRSFLSNPSAFFKNRGFETAEGVAGYLFELGLANDYTPLEWDVAVDILTDNGRIPFDINSASSDMQVRRLLATVLAYPSYQLQ